MPVHCCKWSLKETGQRMTAFRECAVSLFCLLGTTSAAAADQPELSLKLYWWLKLFLLTSRNVAKRWLLVGNDNDESSVSCIIIEAWWRHQVTPRHSSHSSSGILMGLPAKLWQNTFLRTTHNTQSSYEDHMAKDLLRL